MHTTGSMFRSWLWALIPLFFVTFPAPSAGELERPEVYPTVAEDISATVWARCEFDMSSPSDAHSLAFFAYQYHENDTDLTVTVNDVTVTVPPDSHRGAFRWRTVRLPGGCLRDGKNEVVFSTDSPATNTWALGIEFDPDPRGSAKSTDRGESWYNAALGYNYSVTGNYAVRILDAKGSTIAAQAPEREGENDERRVLWASWSPPPVPESPSSLNMAPFSTELEFSGGELLDSMRDGGVEMDYDAGSARLRRGEIVSNEMGNAQLNIDRSRFEDTDPLKTPWWLGEQISDTVWIRKELELATAETDSAFLMFYYQINPHSPRKGSYLQSEGGSTGPLHITLNGVSLDPVPPDTGWRNRTEDWRLVAFPSRLLKRGLNDIVMHTDAHGDWRFAYENTTASDHSARSTDAGRTWDYDRLGENANDNGEYLIRFWLDRYNERGCLWSRPFSLGGEDEGGFLRRLEDVAVHIDTEGTFPPGTAARVSARFGAEIVPSDGSWTEWETAAPGGKGIFSPRDDNHRFMQWRVELSTSSRLETPVLTAVRARISGRCERNGDGPVSIAVLDNPPLRLSSLSHSYDSSDNHIMKTLREAYPLEEIMARESTEYEGFLRLASRVHELRFYGRERGREHRETYGIDTRRTHWSPNNALWAMNMYTRGYGHLDRPYGAHCHDYNLAFVGCLKALGYIARPLIMTRMIPPGGGHSFPEVWSGEYDKWVYVDPYRGQYYIRDDGVPVNTMELHEAQFDSTLFNRISTVRLERLFASAGEREKDDRPARGPCPKGYESFGIWPRSNLMDEPAPYPIWDGVMSFRWDGRIWYQNADVRFLPEFSRYTQRRDDIHWSVNQCFIQPYAFDDGVCLVVSHTMPNFKTLEYRFDRDGSWQAGPPVITPDLENGVTTIEVRAVNDFGRKGAPSMIRLVKS